MEEDQYTASTDSGNEALQGAQDSRGQDQDYGSPKGPSMDDVENAINLAFDSLEIVPGEGIAVVGNGRRFLISRRDDPQPPLVNQSEDAAADDFPWKGIIAGTSGSDVLVEVSPAQVGGLTPTIGGNPMTDLPRPQLTIPNTGDYAVYVQMDATLTTTAEDYVTSGTLDTAVVDFTSGSEAPASSGTTYYRLIFTVTDGAINSQILTSSFWVRFLDYGAQPPDGTATLLCIGG